MNKSSVYFLIKLEEGTQNKRKTLSLQKEISFSQNQTPITNTNTDMLISSSPSCFSLHNPPIHHHHTNTLFLPSSPLTLSLHHRRTPSFLHPSSPPAPPPLHLAHAKPPTADKSGEQKWVHEGLITESLPNGMFRVRLDNEDLILGYVSGKIRKNFVRILPGDRVKVEVSRYDSSKGRIVYRLRSTTSS
ncbi:hypothetical protein PIB30_032464 [Stylosanthes scabra]|uniref:S1-like domain-containing protein n=1 Tax=Stylosanthes scabra TaxID=79078 RepID=A0ABU6SC11_9FABA|nr:hypothetical protein [Stylosanthes scabra]